MAVAILGGIIPAGVGSTATRFHCTAQCRAPHTGWGLALSARIALQQIQEGQQILVCQIVREMSFTLGDHEIPFDVHGHLIGFLEITALFGPRVFC